MSTETTPISPEINKTKKLDALIVLGHNIGVGWKGKRIRLNPDHLSGHSKLSAIAAAIAYKDGLTGKLIFSSGHTAGKRFPSEAQAMKAFILKRYPEIPQSDILTEDRSIDTSGNAIESRKIVRQCNFINVGLMSTGDHLVNAAVLFQRLGLKIKEENRFASEEVIAKHMKKISTPEKPKDPYGFLEGYRNSPQVVGDRKKERIRARLLRTIDRRGFFLRQIAKVAKW